MFIIRIIRRIKYIPIFLYESFKWEYETCKICGTAFRINWAVKDEIWQNVMKVDDGSGGSLCLDCFIKKAEKININLDLKDFKIDLFYPTLL